MKLGLYRGLHAYRVIFLFLLYRRLDVNGQSDESHHFSTRIDTLHDEEIRRDDELATGTVQNEEFHNSERFTQSFNSNQPELYQESRANDQISSDDPSYTYGSQTQSTSYLITLILKSSSFRLPVYKNPTTRIIYSKLNHTNYWPFNMERVRLPPGYQSPINIRTERIDEINMPPLDTHSYEELDETAELICFNTGQTIECKVRNGTIPPYIQGGPLPSKYIFDNIHWHWGKGAIGSEHLIDGKPYAAEVHVVHYKEQYGSFEVARKKQDGLAIFALFARISSEDNADLASHFDDILRHMLLPARVRPTKWHDVFKFVHRIVLNNQQWMTYPGSLTSVPYKESVTWLVYFQPFNISLNQLDALRSTLTVHGHRHTVHRRPIHDLRGDNRPLLVRIRSPMGDPVVLA